MAGPRSIVDLIRNPPKTKPTWIENAILPRGGVFLFGGESKIGKSFLCIEMVRALVTGTPLYGCSKFGVPDRARVLLIEQELGEAILSPRLVKIFTEEEQAGRLDSLTQWMYYASKTAEMDLSSRNGVLLLERWIEEVRPNVVFLDPIGKLHNYSENDAGDINQLFHTLQGLVCKYQELGLSFVMSHHFGKLSPDPRTARDELDPLNFRGSMRWVGDPDTIVTVRKTKRYKTPYVQKGYSPEYRDEFENAYFKWWEVEMKFTLRAGSEPDNCLCTINQENDFRVRFVRFLEEVDEDMPKVKRKTELPRLK